MLDKDLTVIAEIGVNHEGNFNKACELLKLAAINGADYVKFQSYTANKFISSNDTARLVRVNKFCLTENNFIELKKIADSLNVGFLSTPVTEDWVDKLNPLCNAFKIASGDITFAPVLQAVCKTGKLIILSTGGANIDEIDAAVEYIKQNIGSDNIQDRLILMHCVSAYPTPIKQANILSIPYLRDRYNVHVGYSNHVMGMNACLGAVALGAKVIEVHFTDCKDGREFRDHALSFDANDLKEFVDRAHDINKALGNYEKIVQPCEIEAVPLMRKGVIAAKDIKKGSIITENDLMYARPATEFTSSQFSEIVGHIAKEDINLGFVIKQDAI